MAPCTQYCLILLCSISAIIYALWSYESVLVNDLSALEPKPSGRGITHDLDDSARLVGNESWQHHPLCPHQKRRYFPHFSYPPATPRQWITAMDTTNATYTRFSIVNDKRLYAVCDQLELLIEARNGYDEPKTYGGDLFRAKIFTKNSSFSAGSGTDGEVVDLGNGKYSAFFTLKWSGTVCINVTLVVPSEAVFELQNLRETLQPRENYIGKFSKEVDGKPVEEDVRCGHVPVDRLRSICNFSDPRVGFTWYCQKPNSSLLSCEDWKAFKTLEWQYNAFIEDQGYSKRTSVVHRPAAPIEGLPSHVTVTRKSGNIIKERVDRLPACGQQHDHLQVIPWVAGFYQNDHWYPPTCKVNTFPLDGTRRLECMTGKHFYFYGDSTIRQVFSTMGTSLVGAKHQEGHWVASGDTQEAEHNIHLHYNFHHIPIRNFRWYNLDTLRFVTNELDRIGSDEPAVIAICLWAHFQPLYRSFYEQRIRSIADAAQRLLDRNTKAVIMFKGGNTQNPYGPRVQYLNEHYARDNEEALRRILRSYPRIHFLDAWDMSKGQLALADTHPPEPHLSNLVNQILTIACPE